MTSEGEEYGEVKAQDFVTGLKHAADKKSQAIYLVQKSVKGLDDYVSGKTSDFSTVGVKAIDDYTVQYTLSQPESFWNSKTTMGILMPVNGEFLKSKGDNYGQGTSPSSILYCGPYLIKSITSKSSAILEKNPTYWDADNVKISKVKLTYYDGQDSESLIRGFDNGDYTVARVFPNGSNYKSVEKKHKDDIVYTDQGSSTYNLSFNIDRQAYEITKKTTDAQKASTKKAILNKDFRQTKNSIALAEISEDLSGWALVLIRYVYACLLAPIVEELVFRDLVMTALAPYQKYKLDMLVSASLFSLSHVWQHGWDLPSFIVYLVPGLLFCAVLRYTKSIYWAILQHASWNSFLTLVSLLVSGI